MCTRARRLTDTTLDAPVAQIRKTIAMERRKAPHRTNESVVMGRMRGTTGAFVAQCRTVQFEARYRCLEIALSKNLSAC